MRSRGRHRERSHTAHRLPRRRLDRHRSTSRADHQLGTDADALSRPGRSDRQPGGMRRDLEIIHHGLRLDKFLSQMKKGDYLFIHFGHNDMKQNWPQLYVKPFTTHKQYLKVFIAEARRRGATPVLVTPMQRHNFDGPKIRNTLGEFPESVRQTAQEENVALIDLTRMSTALYEAIVAGFLGQSRSD